MSKCLMLLTFLTAVIDASSFVTFPRRSATRLKSSPSVSSSVRGAAFSKRPQRQQRSNCTSLALFVRGGAAGSIAMRVSNYIGASTLRCWMALMFSITTEIGSTTLLAIAQKEKSGVKLLVALSTYMVSLLSFTTCLAKIDVSIAYAVWSALGTATLSAIGILCFGEKADGIKLMCIGMILLGVVGLNIRTLE